VLLLVPLFAGRGMISYVTTAVDKVEDQFKSSVPSSLKSSVLAACSGSGPEIERNMQMIASEEVEVAKLERQLSKTESSLAKSRDEILRSRGSGIGQQSFRLCWRSYSSTEVKTDLANRFAHYRTSEATVDQLKNVLRAPGRTA